MLNTKVLKKGAFNKSRHPERYAKRGAMFGLDARIALAIFGALSVISGAALYSAIKQARVTSIVAELDNISKAWAQYYLDTGEPIKCLSNFRDNGACDNISFSGVDASYRPPSGWNGPYINWDVFTDQFPNTDIHLSFADEENEQPHLVSNRCLDASKPCIAYVTLNKVGTENLSLLQEIEGVIDGVNGTGTSELNGNFRYHQWNASPVYQAAIYKLGRYK